MIKSIQILTILLFFQLRIFGQEFPVPEHYSIVDSVSGDLDNDSIKELIVAYNTEPENDTDGVPRELIIYKLVNDTWIEWKKSKEALYGSRDGGMMGDPFGQIEIKKGVLIIGHNGGSSWKWGHTDSYRFQHGDFFLIGYSATSGKLCEYWEEVDFNLSTGNLIVKKEYESCENESQEIYKRENEVLSKTGLLITFQARQEKEIKIVTPQYGHEIYIANGKQ